MPIPGIDSGVKKGMVDIDKGCLVGERRRIPTPVPAIPEAVPAAVANLVREFF